MRAQLDGHVAIFVEQLYQLIERLFGFGTQGGLVKIVEDVVYQHRNGDGGQRELQGVFFRFVHLAHAQFFGMVQESLACGQQQIVDIRLDDVGKRPLAGHAQRLVGAVAAHDAHLCGRQFVAIHLVHPSLDGLYNLRILKPVDVIPAPCVASVG